MARNKDEKVVRILNEIKDSSKSIEENTKDISEKLKNNNEENDNENSTKIEKWKKIIKIIEIISVIFSICGISICSIYKEVVDKKPIQYEIYLYSEYSKVTLYQETNMTATLNFEADSVSITANLASGNTDTLEMNRKNSNEWEKKVIFNETGVHQIVVTTMTPDGDILKNSIEVEVVPISFNFFN